MNVSELQQLLAGLPADTPVNVAIYDQDGITIDATAGRAAGLSYDMVADGRCEAVWLTGQPIASVPPAGEWQCACGQLLRTSPGEPDPTTAIHLDCGFRDDLGDAEDHHPSRRQLPES